MEYALKAPVQEIRSIPRTVGAAETMASSCVLVFGAIAATPREDVVQALHFAHTVCVKWATVP